MRARDKAPGDMRAVEHRVILVHRRVRLLATEHEARYFGRLSIPLREQLIDACAGADLATGRERRTGKEVAGLRAMNVSLLCLFVVEAADEEHFLAEVGEGREDFAEFHLFAFAFGPPFFGMKTVTGENHRQPHRRLAGGLDASRWGIAPNGERFHPGQRHGDADPA